MTVESKQMIPDTGGASVTTKADGIRFLHSKHAKNCDSNGQWYIRRDMSYRSKAGAAIQGGWSRWIHFVCNSSVANGCNAEFIIREDKAIDVLVEAFGVAAPHSPTAEETR